MNVCLHDILEIVDKDVHIGRVCDMSPPIPETTFTLDERRPFATEGTPLTVLEKSIFPWARTPDDLTVLACARHTTSTPHESLYFKAMADAHQPSPSLLEATLDFCFETVKSGVFVHIAHNKLFHFIPIANGSDVGLAQWHDMISDTCNHLQVHDCMFILHTAPATPTKTQVLPSAAPYSTPDHLDVPFPSPQDWDMMHVGRKFASYQGSVRWENKTPTPPLLPWESRAPELDDSCDTHFKFTLAKGAWGNLLHLGFCILCSDTHSHWFDVFGLVYGNIHDTSNVSDWHCIRTVNVEETLAWCSSHDAECKQIAANALDFHRKWMTTASVHQYVADMCNTISSILVPQKASKCSLPAAKLKTAVLPLQTTTHDKTCIVVPCTPDQDKDAFQEHYKGRTILFVEQTPPLNRGAMYNAGVHYLMKHKPNIDTFILHDIHVRMPAKTVTAYYGNATQGFVHLGNLVQGKQKRLLGRVVKVHADTYRAMNGYSNLFYGGGEEDALRHRITTCHRPKGPKVGTETVNTVLTQPDLVLLDRMQWTIEGFNTIDYHIVNQSEHEFVTHLTVQLEPLVSEVFDHEMELLANPREWLTIVVPIRLVKGVYVPYSGPSEEWDAAEKTQQLHPLTFTKQTLSQCKVTLLHRKVAWVEPKPVQVDIPEWMAVRVYADSNNIPIASAPLTATKHMVRYLPTSPVHDSEEFLEELTQPVRTLERERNLLSLYHPTFTTRGCPEHSTFHMMMKDCLVTVAVLPHETVSVPQCEWVRLPWTDYNQGCRPESTMVEKLLADRLSPHLYYSHGEPAEFQDLLTPFEGCLKRLKPFYSVRGALQQLSKEYVDGNTLPHEYAATLQTMILRHCNLMKRRIPTRIRTTTTHEPTYSEQYVANLAQHQYHPTITFAPTAPSVLKTVSDVHELEQDNAAYEATKLPPVVQPNPMFQHMDRAAIKAFFQKTHKDATTLTKHAMNHRAVPGDRARVVVGDHTDYYKWSGSGWVHERQTTSVAAAPTHQPAHSTWKAPVNTTPLSEPMRMAATLMQRGDYHQLRLYLQSIRATEQQGWYVHNEERLAPLILCQEKKPEVTEEGMVFVHGFAVHPAPFVSHVHDPVVEDVAPSPHVILRTIETMYQCTLPHQDMFTFYLNQSAVHGIAAALLLTEDTIPLDKVMATLKRNGVKEDEDAVKRMKQYLSKQSSFQIAMARTPPERVKASSKGTIHSTTFHAANVDFTTHSTSNPPLHRLVLTGTPVVLETPQIPSYTTQLSIAKCELPLHGVPSEIVEESHAILSNRPAHYLITLIHSMYSKHTVSGIPPSMTNAVAVPLSHPVQVSGMLPVSALYEMSANELVCYLFNDVVPCLEDPLAFHQLVHQDFFDLTWNELR